jgi:glycosyltransferase involved in cell wall biosynthesis
MPVTPLLSVFIPVYNGADFVREALESVIDNGFSDLEIVVVDDASVDDTVRVVESIRHPALRLIRHAANLGIGMTRQRGIALLRGQYAALLDHDDIAVAGRFERQVARLAAPDGPDIVGGAIERFGNDDRPGTVVYPAGDAAIKTMLLFTSPVINPTACMKLAPFRAGLIDYSPDLRAAEDYALWVDAMRAGLRFENLGTVVTRYRRHPASYTATAYDSVVAQMHMIRGRVAATYFPSLSAGECAALADALSSRISSRQGWIDGVSALAHAAILAPAVPGIDAGDMLSRLAKQLTGFIGRGLKSGVADYDTLEAITDSDQNLERWRAMDRGALDTRIMELFG